MKGKSYIAENREIAFRVYCEEGGNVEATLRRLEKEHGLKLSKKTFYEWMKKFNFEERLKKVDAARQETRDSQLSFEEKMLNDLIVQKNKYEKYFETISGIDNQSQYAYTNIIKTIMEARKKLLIGGTIRKAETDKALTKEELLKMLKEDIYGLNEAGS